MNFPPQGQLSLISRTFPERFCLKGLILQRVITVSPSMEELADFIYVMQESIGHHYQIHRGANWKKDKIYEMQDDALVYISYKLDGKTVGFLSFLLTKDEEELVLYLYEIHVLPKYQGIGLGRFLIYNFHGLVTANISAGALDGIALDLSSEIQGTKLTVFGDNNVINWYFKLGYTYAEESPRPKMLRSGKSVMPDYCILIRRI